MALTMQEFDYSDENLTGAQIQSVMDYCLYKALEPVVLYSDIFNLQLNHLLYKTVQNRKRRTSALDREEFIQGLCTALACVDREVRFKQIRALKIERSFVYRFLEGVLKYAQDYKQIYSDMLTAELDDRKICELKLDRIENELGFDKNLFQSINLISTHLELFFEFRNSIVKQYIRHCYKIASAHKDKKSRHYNVGDLSQSSLVRLMRGLDKYDSGCGTLTSYLNYWLYDNLTHGKDFEYGIAYSLPASATKQLAQNNGNVAANFSVSIDQSNDEDDDHRSFYESIQGDDSPEEQQQLEREHILLLKLIKIADVDGLGRLHLGIDEYFSDSELELMRKNSIKPWN